MRVGPLIKLEFKAFRDKRVMNEEIGSFTVPINPESLGQAVQVNQDRSQPQGAESNDPHYSGTPSPRVTLNLLFDNTGTVEGNRLEGVPVLDQLAAFQAVVSDMDPVSHKPPYLMVICNQFIFEGVLNNLDVKYVLFNSLMEPVRAKVTVTIEQYKEPQRRVNDEDKQSPDLTHLRKIKEGDNLPLMNYSIYGDTKYYLQVARANGLTNFRKLNVGSEIIFPAIDKEING